MGNVNAKICMHKKFIPHARYKYLMYCVLALPKKNSFGTMHESQWDSIVGILSLSLSSMKVKWKWIEGISDVPKKKEERKWFEGGGCCIYATTTFPIYLVGKKKSRWSRGGLYALILHFPTSKNPFFLENISYQHLGISAFGFYRLIEVLILRS